MKSDKRAEYERFDDRAKSLLASGISGLASGGTGALAVAEVYRAPYIRYEEHIGRFVETGHSVLELGAGTGIHTESLARTGASVVASDISPHSLQLMSRWIMGRVTMVTADMESLPFANDSFDVVTSAGSLSYGDPRLVDGEVRRVLKPEGVFLCVDSLHHNPMYKLNRWYDYKRGKRTRSTLEYMPTEQRIAAIARAFGTTSVEYFGAISFLMPVLSRMLGKRRAAGLTDAVDRLIHTRRSAFKFVLVARGPR